MKEEKFIIEIEFDNFKCDIERDDKIIPSGTRFYGVSIEGHNQGSSSPCLDKKETIESIKESIKSYEIKERNVTFIDKTGEFVLGELFGVTLNSFF